MKCLLDSLHPLRIPAIYLGSTTLVARSRIPQPALAKSTQRVKEAVSYLPVANQPHGGKNNIGKDEIRGNQAM